MTLARSWGNSAPYQPQRRLLKEQRGVYQLQRPKSLAEVNHFRPTPYTERICWGCRRKLAQHWYLPFLDPIKCSKLWCRKDATAYFYKEKYKL